MVNSRLLVALPLFAIAGCGLQANQPTTQVAKTTAPVTAKAAQMTDEEAIKGKTPVALDFGGTRGVSGSAYLNVSPNSVSLNGFSWLRVVVRSNDPANPIRRFECNWQSSGGFLQSWYTYGGNNTWNAPHTAGIGFYSIYARVAAEFADGQIGRAQLSDHINVY